MKDYTKKKKTFQVLIIVGMCVLFLGLIVMMVGLFQEEASEDSGVITILVGLGAFVSGTVLICVASVLQRKYEAKRKEQIKASLPEDTILLYENVTAQFTEEGLRILHGDTFGEFEPVIPYSLLSLYRICYRSSPRAKGKERISFGLPAGKVFTAYEEEEEGSVTEFFDVGEEVLPLAEKYGVPISDSRQPRIEKPTLLKKFSHRKEGQRKAAIKWTFISIGVFAALIGIVVLLAIMDVEIGSGLIGGVSAAIVTPCVLHAINLWQRNLLYVYEEGVLIRTMGAKIFLFWAEIEHIRIDNGFYFDCGYMSIWCPAAGEAFDYLKEFHPEKFVEEVPEKLEEA